MIQEYAAPKDIPEEKAKRRLTDIIRAAIQVLDVDANNVVLKVRERQKGTSQYEKLGQQAQTMQITEYGVKLIVNLYDYLDTGLFLDHKITRRRLGQMAQGKDFLNLFAYLALRQYMLLVAVQNRRRPSICRKLILNGPKRTCS